MNKFLTFMCLLSFITCFSQQESIIVTNLGNSYEVKMEKNANEGITVYIRNMADGNAEQLIFEKDLSASSFVEQLAGKIENVSATYSFKFAEVDFADMNKSALANTDFQAKVNLLSEADYTKLLKLKMIYNMSPNTGFIPFVTAIAVNTSKPLFTNQPLFTIRKTSTSALEFTDGTTTFPVTTETQFYKDFYQNYKSDNTVPGIILEPADIAKFNKVALSEENKKIIEELYNKLSGKSKFKFLNTVSISDSTTNGPSKSFTVSIFSESETFVLKFCDENFSCKDTQKMKYNIEKTIFLSNINNFVKSKLEEPARKIGEDELNVLYFDCKTFNEKKMIGDVSKPFLDTIQSLAQKLDNIKTQFSGKLKVNKEISVYTKSPPEKWFWFINKHRKVNQSEDKKFIIKSTTVRFFNNKAKDVVVIGHLKDKPNKEYVVLNADNSIPIRSFSHSFHLIPISVNDDADKLLLKYNDIFDYYPHGSTFNYSTRNKEYAVKAGDTVKIEQRKLMDYFTAVIFSDVLGLNSENANGLLQAEGRIKIPMWIFNYKKMAFFHSLDADVNATIYNGFDDTSRYITPVDQTTKENELTTVTINNFEYIKYNNISAGISINYFNMELKGLSTEWSLGYGIRYYRTGLRYTFENEGADVVKQFQMNALSHELSTNFEIRPQLNFGADLNFGFNWLNARGSNGNIPVVYNNDNNNDDRSVLRVQLNLYSKLNPDESNSGIYARLGGFYHLGAKDFYPQILVGYATNLSSFVNKFKKDGEK